METIPLNLNGDFKVINLFVRTFSATTRTCAFQAVANRSISIAHMCKRSLNAPVFSIQSLASGNDRKSLFATELREPRKRVAEREIEQVTKPPSCDLLPRLL